MARINEISAPANAILLKELTPMAGQRQSSSKTGENVNKSLFIGGALALVLTACAAGTQKIYTDKSGRGEGFSSAFVTQPNPTAPNIFIVAGKIVIDQEPIRPPGDREGDPIAIYWALEQGGSYTFPQHGVEIKGHPTFCSPVTGTDYVFSCKYRRPAPDTIYQYTVRVKDRSGRPIRDLDPSIMN